MEGMQAGAQSGFLEGGELRGPRRVLWVSPCCHGNLLLLDESTELKYLT